MNLGSLWTRKHLVDQCHLTKSSNSYCAFAVYYSIETAVWDGVLPRPEYEVINRLCNKVIYLRYIKKKKKKKKSIHAGHF